jgi:hypothetical protein
MRTGIVPRQCRGRALTHLSVEDWPRKGKEMSKWHLHVGRCEIPVSSLWEGVGPKERWLINEEVPTADGWWVPCRRGPQNTGDGGE